MNRRICLPLAIAVIGTHGRIACAGEAADDLDTWTINPHDFRGNEQQGRARRRSRDDRGLT